MTATEEFRRMLDECGVEWAEYGDGYTLLRHGGREYTVQPNVCNRLIVTNLTPEQAIAATLGRGTCHDAGGKYSWGNWTCSECGFVMPSPFKLDELGEPLYRFCPNCGRRVVDDG